MPKKNYTFLSSVLLNVPEFFSFYLALLLLLLFGVFLLRSEVKNCLADAGMNWGLNPRKCFTQVSFNTWLLGCLRFLKEEGVKMQIVILLSHLPVEPACVPSSCTISHNQNSWLGLLIIFSRSCQFV